MSTELSIGMEDVVVAKDKEGNRYYVAGKPDRNYTLWYYEEPIGRFLTWHRRYSIGLKHNYETPRDFWIDLFHSFYDKGEIKEELRENFKKLCSLLWAQARVEVVPRENLKEEDVFHKDLESPYYLCRLNDVGDIEWEGDWYELSTNDVDKMTQEDFEAFWDCLERLDLYEYELMARELPDFVFSRVYMYEHSGRVLSLSDFGDKWDSGCLGIFCCTKKEFEKGWPVDNTDEWKKTFFEYADGVLEEWNEAELGNVWGFAYADADKLDSYKDAICDFVGYGFWKEKLTEAVFDHEEDFSSCWGFVGDYEKAIQQYCSECHDLEIVDVVK